MNRWAKAAACVDPAERKLVRDLVAASPDNPLAPFALRPEKSYLFAPGGGAAIGYRVKLGTAVASGDPVGAVDEWAAAIAAFVRWARQQSLRVAVLGAGERARGVWAQYGLWSLAIGRDVVVRPAGFTLQGRRFRNVRQAVARTHNAGIQVQFQREGELDDATIADLRELMVQSNRQDHRGFSMILGRLFDGSTPDALVAVARDATGAVVAAHRYLWAGSADLSLDLPIRGNGSPNGVDERLVVEVVRWGAGHNVERVSLSFAPFPDLFGQRNQLSPLSKLAYGAAHLLDPLISVERLYRYLRKFHAFDQQRFVMLRRREIVVVALAMLLLEFGR